jgi:lipopolysaccharide export LptBFGC system permease protein LptF
VLDSRRVLRAARRAKRHKNVGATILVGAVSFICLVAFGPHPALLGRATGAMTVSLLLGLILYVSISVVHGLKEKSEMVSAVMYSLTAVALILLGFFVFIWIFKRMWEAA